MAFVPFVESDQPTMLAFNEKFQQNYEAALEFGLDVVVGSYTGTGAYGKENPTKVNLPFKPSIFMVRKAGESLPQFSCLALYGSESVTYPNDSNSEITAQFAWGVNFVSYYNGLNASLGPAYQFNASGIKYEYVAIGKKEE